MVGRAFTCHNANSPLQSILLSPYRAIIARYGAQPLLLFAKVTQKTGYALSKVPLCLARGQLSVGQHTVLWTGAAFRRLDTAAFWLSLNIAMSIFFATLHSSTGFRIRQRPRKICETYYTSTKFILMYRIISRKILS